MIDLGRWLSESYSIPIDEKKESDGNDNPPVPPRRQG